MPHPAKRRHQNAISPLRTVGVLSAVTGLILMGLPAIASATEAETKHVTITTTLSDGTASAPLVGTAVTVLSTSGGDQIVATGTTSADGSVSVLVPATDTSLIAEASWPGAVGDLVDSTVRREFNPTQSDTVTLPLAGSFGTIKGIITATSDGRPLADLSGSSVTILSGGTAIQRVAVAADGAFRSSALPTTFADDYSIRFEPAEGLTLAGTQPAANPAFALPQGAESPSAADANRSFALVSDGVTPTPKTTTAPEPTHTHTSSPFLFPNFEYSLDPTQPAASDFTAAFGGISESDLAALLKAVEDTHRTIPILRESGQALGLVQRPTPESAAAASQLLSPVVTNLPGVTLDEISLTALDLNAALLAIQDQRAQLLDQQLSSQVTNVQGSNARMAALNAAVRSLNAYVAAPTNESLAAAIAAAGAVTESHAFLLATSDSAETRTAATTLVVSLRMELDTLTHNQQIDMLRLAALTDRRNEAADLMSSITKKLQDARSSIIGNMRSTPVSIGTVQWNAGAINGNFNLTGVTNGKHHLIISFDDIGLTVIAAVTVERNELAETGSEMTVAIWFGAALLVLGAAALSGSSLQTRLRVHA